MDKDVKENLEMLEDHDGDMANLWEFAEFIKTENEEDKKTLLKIFNEEQLKFLKIFAENVVNALEFHTNEDDSTHPDIREKLTNVDGKLRNHRHNLDQTYSANAEF